METSRKHRVRDWTVAIIIVTAVTVALSKSVDAAPAGQGMHDENSAAGIATCLVTETNELTP
jgi:hypothetical protein